jgi:hypothetical protein
MKQLLIAPALALAVALLAPPLDAQIEAYDVIIMNGRIVDGTGNPWFYGDVAIRGDRIMRAGRVGPGRAVRRIDARGLIVAPGFIDTPASRSLTVDRPGAESKVFRDHNGNYREGDPPR